MHIAIKFIQLSFSNMTYQHIDRIAMGRPLGAAMPTIFLGFQEEKLFEITNKPL